MFDEFTLFKFGRKKFGRKKFGESIDQPKGYSLKLLKWMVLVWRITDDSPTSPNFLPAKLSRYTVHDWL